MIGFPPQAFLEQVGRLLMISTGFQQQGGFEADKSLAFGRRPDHKPFFKVVANGVRLVEVKPALDGFPEGVSEAAGQGSLPGDEHQRSFSREAGSDSSGT